MFVFELSTPFDFKYSIRVFISGELSRFENISRQHLNPETGKSYVQDLPDWQFKYYNSWLCKIRFRILDRLINSLNYYGLLIAKKCMKASEFEFLGQGGSNTAILCKTINEVLRISEVHREFKYECLKELYANDTGYTPIKGIVNEEGIKFVILPLLKHITDVDCDLMDKCLNKFIKFMSRHKDFMFTDFWNENFMQSLDETEYYVSDLDMESTSTEDIDDINEYNDMLKGEKTLKISYNQWFYKAFCKKFGIKESGFIFSLIAAGLFKLAGYTDFTIYNEEMERRLLDIIKSEKL